MQGLMLMDRTERRLVMVRSLGELMPLRRRAHSFPRTFGSSRRALARTLSTSPWAPSRGRSYNTEYGNTLCRTSKHKARLANLIELDVTSDEVPRTPARLQPATHAAAALIVRRPAASPSWDSQLGLPVDHSQLALPVGTRARHSHTAHGGSHYLLPAKTFG